MSTPDPFDHFLGAFEGATGYLRLDYHPDLTRTYGNNCYLPTVTLRPAWLSVSTAGRATNPLPRTRTFLARPGQP